MAVKITYHRNFLKNVNSSHQFRFSNFAKGYFNTSIFGSLALDSILFASVSFLGNNTFPLNSSNFLLIFTIGIFAAFNSS
jgi:hypothetical protein